VTASPRVRIRQFQSFRTKMRIAQLWRLYTDARWSHSWELTAEQPWPVTVGHRRYWRRRMSDLTRELQKYGIDAGQIA
jgi:hypothetical protein